ASSSSCSARRMSWASSTIRMRLGLLANADILPARDLEVRRARPERELDDELASFARLALDPDRALVRLDDAPGDEQAQAQAPDVGGSASALEPLEDHVLLLPADAGTEVLDDDPGLVSAVRAGDPNRALR